MTYLDILDSAVKIGLGAMISAMAGWVMMNRGHRQDFRRELFRRRLDRLEEIAKHADSVMDTIGRLVVVRISAHMQGQNGLLQAEENTGIDPGQLLLKLANLNFEAMRLHGLVRLIDVPGLEAKIQRLCHVAQEIDNRVVALLEEGKQTAEVTAAAMDLQAPYEEIQDAIGKEFRRVDRLL